MGTHVSMSRTRFLLLILAIMVAAALGAAAIATGTVGNEPGANNTVTACYGNETRITRLIDNDENCFPNTETKVTWKKNGGLSGVRFLYKETAYDTSPTTREDQLSCDTGEIAVTGGTSLRTTANGQNLSVSASRPLVNGDIALTTGTPNGWYSKVSEISGGEAGNWGLRVWLVCAAAS